MATSNKKAGKKAGKKAQADAADATCTFTCAEVGDTVLDVLREQLNDDSIQADSDFEDDIGIDPESKLLLFIPISEALQRDGCNFKTFSPAACKKADTPGDIIKVICKDFGVK